MVKKILMLLMPLFLFANSDNILSYFQDEIQNQSVVDFEIEQSSYAKLNFIGGFADGIYKLVSYKITPIKDNVYKLILHLEKKRHFYSMTEDIKLYFWYKNSKIVFLSDRGKYRFSFSNPIVKIQKDKNGYIIKRKNLYNFKIPVANGYVVLKIRRD